MINWFKWLVLSVLTLVIMVALGLYISLRLSLPALDGNSATYHVNAPTELSRDSLGHAVINANDIFDAAYALGFAHAQDRFFQMDLQRRAASGGLSQWVGDIALDIDKKARFHQFEKRAKAVFDNLPSKQQELLVRYSHGVNDALSEYTLPPFEYLAAGVDIQQWQPTDSILVIYSMYLDLQGTQVELDLAREALLTTFGNDIYGFITQPSNYQAALDASEIPLLEAEIPQYPASLRAVINKQDSDQHSEQGTEENTDLNTEQDAPPPSASHIKYSNTAIARAQYMGTELPDIGSNNWAVTGNYTATGAGLLANDMHLGLRVPIIWYRAQLNYQESGSNVQVTGVSLPGIPGIVVGTNGHIAWGFTNANLDNVDWIALDDTTPTETVTERILLPEGEHEFKFELSAYGPVKELNGKRYALNWVAHHPFAANLGIINFGTAKSVQAAVRTGQRIAIPTQNLVIVDESGNAAWLPGGAVMDRQQASFTAIKEKDAATTPPKRATKLPMVINPEMGRIWTANARVISAEDFKVWGDGGYALGARGQQIRDRLFEKDIFSETDFYAIQLDNHARFLIPWQHLLYGLLNMQDIEFKPDLAYLNTWSECACEDSVGYTLVKHFRREVIQTLFGGLLSNLDQQGVNSRNLLRGIEPATWQLIHSQPDSWLPADTESFDELLVDAYRRAKHKLLDKYSPVEANMEALAWGKVNALSVEHPFASQIPLVGSMLNMQQVEGFGDTYMPAVQTPSFGASERFFVSPGHLEDAILTLPGGQSGHPLSDFFTAGFNDYATHAATPLLPSEPIHSRTFYKKEVE
ncbi:penicillin acylase family protein [Alteromonas portus]|uniref:Penicillin acylase family protein n=1 Tax=Alteromonas portus TaxID=2565549 RepID=A0A4U0ZJ19_9ALTE|nr:penicillin acylase family protein [Alteromonas portus]TKB04175.1 penicillin acylase family protein [Alteromonas portus]